MEHEGHINAIRRGANIYAVKSLNVTVPCSFTSESNECITEATGWSQAGRSTFIHPSFLPAMPVKPHIRYPPQNVGCSGMVMDHAALASDIENVHHTTLENMLFILSTKMDSAFLHICPLE